MPRNFSKKSPNKTRKSWFCALNRNSARACLLLGVLLFLCPTDRSISRAESAPEWLVTAGKADLAHFGDGSAAVILGEWTDFTVDASGTFVMTERRGMRVVELRSADGFLNAVGQENNAGKV